MSVKVNSGSFKYSHNGTNYYVPGCRRANLKKTDTLHIKTCINMTPVQEIVENTTTFIVHDLVILYNLELCIINKGILFNKLREKVSELAKCIQKAGKSSWGQFFNLDGYCYITEGEESPVEIFEDLPMFSHFPYFDDREMVYYEFLYKKLEKLGLEEKKPTHSNEEEDKKEEKRPIYLKPPIGTVFFKSNDDKCTRIILLSENKASVTKMTKNNHDITEVTYAISHQCASVKHTEFSYMGQLTVNNSNITPTSIHLNFETGGVAKTSSWKCILPEKIDTQHADVVNIFPEKNATVLHKAVVRNIKEISAPKPKMAEVVEKNSHSIKKDLCEFLKLHDSISDSSLTMRIWEYAQDKYLTEGHLCITTDEGLRKALGCEEETLSLGDLYQYIK